MELVNSNPKGRRIYNIEKMLSWKIKKINAAQELKIY